MEGVQEVFQVAVGEKRVKDIGIEAWLIEVWLIVRKEAQEMCQLFPWCQEIFSLLSFITWLQVHNGSFLALPPETR